MRPRTSGSDTYPPMPHRSRRGHRFPKQVSGPTAVAGGVCPDEGDVHACERPNGLLRRETGACGQVGHRGHLSHNRRGILRREGAEPSSKMASSK